jgi:hypothetical protein
MSSIAISSIVFTCVFGGAMFGIFIRATLPQNHLSADSKDFVKLGMGLVATLCALVLGLLIASAKGSYDAQSNELTQMSAQVVLLDRVLAHYGPETKERRDLLRVSVVRILDQTPKLTKIVVSQKTSMTSNGMETDVACCAYCNQRVCPRFNTILTAWACSERCLSSFGESSCHEFTYLRVVGLRRDPAYPGVVHTLQGTDSCFQCPATRRSYASGQIGQVLMIAVLPKIADRASPTDGFAVTRSLEAPFASARPSGTRFSTTPHA